MTDKQDSPKPLDSETVAAYLRLHPEFFIDHDELIQSHPVPTLLIDAGGVVLFVNAAAEQLCNVSRSAMVGRVVYDVIGMDRGYRQRMNDPDTSALFAHRAEIRIGDAALTLNAGGLAFVPRWVFHQSKNLSPTDELVILAITDFGLTKAVLGDYDKRTRLAANGADVLDHA